MIITQPNACNARKTAPGEYGSARNVGCVPLITVTYDEKYKNNSNG